MKTSDSFIFGGRMECVNPNVRMSSFFFFFFSSFFSSFKIGNLFGVKDPIPSGLCSGVVYKFTCERSPPGIGSFTPKRLPISKEEKTNLMSKSLQ